ARPRAATAARGRIGLAALGLLPSLRGAAAALGPRARRPLRRRAGRQRRSPGRRLEAQPRRSSGRDARRYRGTPPRDAVRLRRLQRAGRARLGRGEPHRAAERAATGGRDGGGGLRAATYRVVALRRAWLGPLRL